QEHLAIAEADGERRAGSRADQQVLLALEQERERERTLELRQRGRDRLDGLAAFLELARHQVGDDLTVGLGRELCAAGREVPAQLVEVLDDAVVYDRDPVGGVRMRIVLGRTAMRRPAGVADADGAAERLAVEAMLQVLKLAFGPAALQAAALQGGDPGRVIPAVFEPLERVDHQWGDRLASQYADDPAHVVGAPTQPRLAESFKLSAQVPEITNSFAAFPLRD